jgi:hypothetical protein
VLGCGWVLSGQVLERVCAAGVDMTRMESVIRRHHVKHLSALEESPHDTVACTRKFAHMRNPTRNRMQIHARSHARTRAHAPTHTALALPTQVPYYLVSGLIFGGDAGACEAKLRSAGSARDLLALTSPDWVALLRRYYLARPHVCVRAAPSAARAAFLAQAHPPPPPSP